MRDTSCERNGHVALSTPERAAFAAKVKPESNRGTLLSAAITYRKHAIKNSDLLQTAFFSDSKVTEESNKTRAIRNEILHICSVAGELCGIMVAYVGNAENRQQKEGMAKLLLSLLYTANETFQMNLFECIIKKMALNARKYPAKLCRGKAGKYTSYSDTTGITKTEGQSTLEEIEMLNPDESLRSISEKIDVFAQEREWEQYHTPRNIILALMGEVGELAELFQWKGDSCDTIGDKIFWDKVGQEMADVAIYLLRLAKVSDVDLEKEAVSMALQKNVFENFSSRCGKSPRSTICEDKVQEPSESHDS